MTRETLLAKFKVWLQRAGPQVAESTADKYVRYAKSFMEFAGNVDRATQADVNRWREAINSKRDGTPAAPSTVLTKLAAVRALYAFAQAQGIRANDLTHELSNPKIPERLPRPIETADVERLYDAAKDDLQDTALLEVLYGSGVRRSEAGSLRISNIKSREGLRLIGKGDKERIVPMNETEYRALRDWVLHQYGDKETAEIERRIDKDAAFTQLRQRPEMADVGIFVREDGTPFVDMAEPGHYVWKRIKAIAEKAGIEATPHELRHTFATDLLSAGADILDIGEAMGHSSPATTKIYTKIDNRRIRRLGKIHPRAVVGDSN